MVESTAFPQSHGSRGLAIKTSYKQMGAAGTRFRPVRIPVIAQGAEGTSYSTTKRQVFSPGEAGTLYGFDSPIYQAVESLLPTNGDGVGDIPVTIYPLAKPTGTQAAGDITPSGTATKPETHYVLVNNRPSLPINLVKDDTVAEFITKAIAAINGVVGMPGTASDGTTTLDFTVGWKGTTGNNVHLAVLSPDDADVSLTVSTQITGGTGDASITAALAQIGSVWESHVVNGNDYTDSTLLDEFSAYNEGRWTPQIRKPLVVFTGCNEATLATVTAVTDARKSDRTNVILTNPGSNDLPIVIAADQVRRIAVRAATVPAHDYGALKCPRLTPAADATQWTPDQNETAYDAGCSTIDVVDGDVEIADVVTCYHPTGEIPPAYQYVVDFEKISTMLYNVGLEFGSAEWKGGPPLIPDTQATKEPTAKKPHDGTEALHKIIQAAADDAIISDPDFAKENSACSIDDANPKRLNGVLTFKCSGNANVISIDLDFGFHFGS